MTQTLQGHLAYLLSDAERRLTRRLSDQFRGEGAPVEYWRILQALADGYGHSMGELADAVLMNHPTLTKALDRMASEALVYRRQSAADRRRVAVYLSVRGKALLRRLNAQAVEQQQLIVDEFGAGETGLLMQQLERLLECLSQERVGVEH